MLIKGILSYPTLFQPRSVNPGDDPKYSVTILLDKNDPQLAQIQAEIETAKKNGFPNGFPTNGKTPLHDCAVTQPDRPDMAGYYELRAGAKADQKPAVVDMDRQPVIDPGLVFAGSIVYAVINFFTYSMPVNKGVSAGLNGVMITGEEGQLGRLDGRPTVDQMFANAPASLSFDEPAPPAPPQPSTTVILKDSNGPTLEQYKASGWTEEMLVNKGLAIYPSFS